MRIALMAISLVALAACSPPAPAPPPASVEGEITVNGCPAHASSVWNGGARVVFGVDAVAEGASCADANATIIIRDAMGATVHTETVAVAATQALAGAESVDDMGRRLAEWITPAGASTDSTGDLPEWQAGAAGPESDGMPFTPGAGATRETYEAMRATDAPMYCYERRFGEAVCMTVGDGVLTQIGVQTYAG